MNGIVHTLKNLLLLTTIFLLGALAYWLLYTFGCFRTAYEVVVWSFGVMYKEIGIVIIGLLPLSIFLISLITLIVAEHLGYFSFTRSPVSKLTFVIDTGPMLGILGTMISLSSAMLRVDISNGVQEAIKDLSALVGQALHSSVFGILLALVAYLFKTFCSKKEIEDYEASDLDS